MLKEPHVFFLRNLNESVLCLLNLCVFIFWDTEHCGLLYNCTLLFVRYVYTHRLLHSITYTKSHVYKRSFRGKFSRDCLLIYHEILRAGLTHALHG